MLARGPGRGHRLGADGHAVAQRLEPLGDDLLARLEPVFDDPERVDTRTDLDVAERDLAVGADHGDAVQVLQLLHGPLRNQERAGLGVEEHARTRRTGPAAGRCRGWEVQLHAEGAGGAVDGALDRPDRARLRACVLPSASVSWMPDALALPVPPASGSRLMMRR